MTVKKAYDELENEGYIITRQGKGSFVISKNVFLSKELHQKEIESYISKIVDISKKYDISKEEYYRFLIIYMGVMNNEKRY